MIIFYKKKTGKIVGTIDGRVHGQEHAKMWIGDKKEVDRIVVQWKSVGKKEKIIRKKVEIGQVVDGDGFYKPIFKEVKDKIEITEFAPDTKQKRIFKKLDKNSENIYDFAVNVTTKELIKNDNRIA